MKYLIIMIISGIFVNLACNTSNATDPSLSHKGQTECNCILDDLTRKETCYEEHNTFMKDEFNSDINPQIQATIRNIIDFDIEANLDYKYNKNSNAVTHSNKSQGYDYSQDFIQKYMIERALFCAKFQALCKDTSISYALKNKIYLDELDKLSNFIRDNVVTNKVDVPKSTKIKSQSSKIRSNASDQYSSFSTIKKIPPLLASVPVITKTPEAIFPAAVGVREKIITLIGNLFT